MNPVVVGIDVSKQKVDCAFSVDGKTWHHKVLPNDTEGFEFLVKELGKFGVSTFPSVMEATGRYGEDLAEFLYAHGYSVSLLNPAQIRHYSKSCLKRSKTDKVDARLIAEFSSKHETKPWAPLSEDRKKLRAWERCLETFKRDRTQITNRLEQEKNQEVRWLLEQRQELIEQQIRQLEESINVLLKEEGELKFGVTLLQSIPGIGLMTAFSLLGELPDLSTFTSAKQLSAYAGLNPSIRSSGSSIRGRGALSKMGSKPLRKLLYFPAMAAMRHNPQLKEFAQRLRDKGKKPMVIIAAVMRKLLHIVFGVLKKQQPFHA